MKVSTESRNCIRGAFTILELLIVITLIGLLISLLLPLLSQARRAAGDIESASNLRTHHAVFTVYSIDWEDSFPFLAYPDPYGSTLVRNSSCPRVIRFRFWSTYALWNYSLSAKYYEGECSHPSFYHSQSGQTRGVTPYYYGCSFIARPEYWNYETRTGPDQWRNTYTTEVRYPSEKGLLFAYVTIQKVRRSLPIAFVDGNVRNVMLGEIRPGTIYGDGFYGGGSHHLSDFPLGSHTVDGVRGRDLW